MSRRAPAHSRTHPPTATRRRNRAPTPTLSSPRLSPHYSSTATRQHDPRPTPTPPPPPPPHPLVAAPLTQPQRSRQPPTQPRPTRRPPPGLPYPLSWISCSSGDGPDT